MACGRPKNEFGVGFRGKVDPLVRRLENREFARLHTLGSSKASRTERDPANGVIGRRLVAPGLAALDSEIFHHLPASVRLLPEDGQVGALAMLRLFGLRVRSSDFERAAAVGQVTRAGDLGLLV
jgi:hypothetical protein